MRVRPHCQVHTASGRSLSAVCSYDYARAGTFTPDYSVWDALHGLYMHPRCFDACHVQMVYLLSDHPFRLP